MKGLARFFCERFAMASLADGRRASVRTHLPMGGGSAYGNVVKIKKSEVGKDFYRHRRVMTDACKTKARILAHLCGIEVDHDAKKLIIPGGFSDQEEQMATDILTDSALYATLANCASRPEEPTRPTAAVHLMSILGDDWKGARSVKDHPKTARKRPNGTGGTYQYKRTKIS